jgi:hypothetical protein
MWGWITAAILATILFTLLTIAYGIGRELVRALLDDIPSL